MKRLIFSTLFSMSMLACGTNERKLVVPGPAEPNAIQYVFDGNYEVSAVSNDSNCVHDDAVWNIELADDANSVYRVNTAVGVPYLKGTVATKKINKLSWTEARNYEVQGCTYTIVSIYDTWFDSDGNLTGTLKTRPSNTCRAGQAVLQCDFEIVSNRL